MSKIRILLDGLYEKLRITIPLVVIIGGFIAGFIVWVTAPDKGYWGIDRTQLSLAPIVIPLGFFTVIYAIISVFEIFIGLFCSIKGCKNNGRQLIPLAILFAVTFGVFYVIYQSWQGEYWIDATKYGNNGGIGHVVADMFGFAIENGKIALTSLAVEVAASIAYLLLLNVAKNKYVGDFSGIHIRLQILSGLVALLMFIINCAIYTPTTTLIFAYSVMLGLILVPATIALYTKTCSSCGCYNCGRTLLSTESRTYVDETENKVVSSTDYHYEDDETIYTVKTVAPVTKTETKYTYKCNHCGYVFTITRTL